MSSVINAFARLIAQGYLTEDEALAHVEATERDEATWALGYAVDEWLMRRSYAAVAIIEDMTAMLPCCKADAFARACTINADEFDRPLRREEVRKLCRTVWEMAA